MPLGNKPLSEPLLTNIVGAYGITRNQLEQLERLRSEDTPRRLMITPLLSNIGSQVKKLIDLELKTLQSGHDFQSHYLTLKI